MPSRSPASTLTCVAVAAALLAGSVAGCKGAERSDAPASAEAGPSASTATAAAPTSAAASAPGAAASAPAPAASAAPSAAAAPDAIAAQHVLVAWRGAKGAPAGVTRTKEQARARADEVLAKAKGGADFSDLVRVYSDDLGTKDRMGSLGKFTRDRMVKPFSDAAFALAVGEVGGPVETPFGYHVIKRNQ